MNVYCVQPDVVWHDAPANRERVERMIRDARPSAGALVVLPEMFASGFTGDVAAATDAPERLTADWCQRLAAEFDCTLIAGLVETADDGRGQNQALVCGPEGVIGRYTKIHPFRMGGETEQYQPGQTVKVFQVGGWRVCPLVCYDLRFPETFREAAALGVDLFVVIANWPAKREHHWHALLRARAIENQAYVVGVNRTGSDPNVVYSGGSIIFDCDGHAPLSMDERPAVASTSLDLDALHAFRRRLPFLEDLRSGLSTGLPQDHEDVQEVEPLGVG